MRYLELKEHFKDFPVFSLSDIRKIEPDFHRRRLSEWKEKGYIKSIIKGSYIFSDQEPGEKNKNLLFLLRRYDIPAHPAAVFFRL